MSGIGRLPDVEAYLSGGFSTHQPRMKEKAMFSTDSFMSAEITYREDRVRRDWGAARLEKRSRRAKAVDSR